MTTSIGVATGTGPGALRRTSAATQRSRTRLARREAFGHIDVVADNAGYGLFGAVEESTDDQARSIFDTGCRLVTGRRGEDDRRRAAEPVHDVEAWRWTSEAVDAAPAAA